MDGKDWGLRIDNPVTQVYNPGMKEIVVSSEFISLSEASRRLGISRPTLYTWMATGRLTRYRVEGQVRVLVAEVLRETQGDGG